MRFYSRRTITLFAAALAAATLASQVQAQDLKVIRFGAAYPKSGPMAGGAAATHAPNIALWLHEVNAKGGLMLSSIGRRVPIELVEYDDRTSNEDTVRAIERLVTQDKVDFLLAPYATGANMAVAALFNRYGYPQLVATAVTDRGPEFAKRWPNSFWLAGGGTAATQSLVEVLKELRDQGKIGKRIAMVSVADAFGIDLATAGRKVFKDNGFEIVMDASYPLGTQDVAPIISEAKRLDPDAFIAFSYPPDTFAITEQARIASFNPKVFYAGVGTVFPTYKAKFGTAIEGIMGIGGWNPDLPETKAYIARHKEVTGKEPDSWGSSVVYASFQMLAQAIERVGSLDRAAIIKDIQSGTFDTVLGKVKLEDNQRRGWWVGQWQNGSYYGLAPTSFPGAKPAVLKPAWPPQ
jgi:branched-chain amino acid transport system substrate-binding protein